MSGPNPRMSGESIPGKDTRETATVVATDLSRKDAYKAPEKSKAETDLTNNITEPVKTNKYLETMKVFGVEAQPKSDPTKQLESPETYHLHYHSLAALKENQKHLISIP